MSRGSVDGDVGFDDFARTAGERVRRALVACYGVEVGSEAAAEAMAVAWQRWPEVAAMGNPAGWLFRVGQSKARPHLRWTRRRGEFPGIERAAATAADGPSLDVLTALGRLPVAQRTAMVLVKCHGHTYREAAEVMGVSEAAVTNHVHRGLARLRSMLEVE